MKNQLGRRVSDINLHEIVKELARNDVRITVIENIVEKQTEVLQSIEKRFTWGGGVVAGLLFLMTPIGEHIYKLLIG